MNQSVFLPSAYLAPVSYYCKLLSYPAVWIDQWEHYCKQTFRNRCLIATSQGVQALCVPVEKPTNNVAMKDIRVSDHGNWRHLHWQALATAYDRTPYFEYYADDFLPFYTKPYKFLMEFNQELCSKICELIQIKPNIQLTNQFILQPDAYDCRSLFTSKPTAPDPLFEPAPYYQVFAQRLGFIPNLSIVDLLFNMGPESVLILRKSFRTNTH